MHFTETFVLLFSWPKELTNNLSLMVKCVYYTVYW